MLLNSKGIGYNRKKDSECYHQIRHRILFCGRCLHHRFLYIFQGRQIPDALADIVFYRRFMDHFLYCRFLFHQAVSSLRLSGGGQEYDCEGRALLLRRLQGDFRTKRGKSCAAAARLIIREFSCVCENDGYRSCAHAREIGRAHV
jgi:hypothetical protein